VIRKKHNVTKWNFFGAALLVLFLVVWHGAGFLHRARFWCQSIGEMRLAAGSLPEMKALVEPMGRVLQFEDGTWMAIRCKDLVKHLPSWSKWAAVALDSSGRSYRSVGPRAYSIIRTGVKDSPSVQALLQSPSIEVARERLKVLGFEEWHR